MQPWVWLTAYVLGFGLLQVVLYRHFSRRSPTHGGTEGRVARASGGHTSRSESTDSVVCTHCGTVNESHQMIRYCSDCSEPLR